MLMTEVELCCTNEINANANENMLMFSKLCLSLSGFQLSIFECYLVYQHITHIC